MNNMDIYNKLKSVPSSAQKKISGGRLTGMTDIKPMWRIEKLTETFGPAGLGWKTKTVNKQIIDGANDEKVAIVDIELYVKYDDKWSEPIEGSGGSSFVAKESKGLYTSDECYKMAYTDALSVACKAIGMGADIYWGDSKYTTNDIKNEEKASEAQIALLKRIWNTEEKVNKNLEALNAKSIEDISKKTASEYIARIKEAQSNKAV